MAHRLNTNKQFMVGNGLLAFAVIFIVVLFLYMSMRMQREKTSEDRYYTESYTISLTKGFINDSLSIYMNDSLIINKNIHDEPFVVKIDRFADQSTLMIVDNETDILSTFDLAERGGSFSFIKDADGIKQLAK